MVWRFAAVATLQLCHHSRTASSANSSGDDESINVQTDRSYRGAIGATGTATKPALAHCLTYVASVSALGS
ncbi:hypothetical protein B0J15DRAFT_495078 [Fusarium solani]|uniref:Uncharacterized protein n=1 Tax=Fusarium solani TaxID=169388 RepID=A0A9P9KF85_FUSSL|nr:uncharacterized protein B0J15DRAFT_495078 [Fusarium solani]KAH7255030.1 hypothetical protein B0J15DRAFT_495078 [Fusarium solani]